MKKIKLFGKNVMLQIKEKESGGLKLLLPESAKENKDNANMFDLVVVNVGDDVTRVKVGDVVMSNLGPFKSINPVTGETVVMVQEDMIQGVVVDRMSTKVTLG